MSKRPVIPGRGRALLAILAMVAGLLALPVVPLPRHQLQAAQAAFAGDYVVTRNASAYSSDARVGVLTADGNDFDEISHGDGQQPSVSLDGKRAAFISERAGIRTTIWSVNTDGSGLAQVTPTVTSGQANDTGDCSAHSPVINNDGSEVVFSYGCYPTINNYRLYAANADGTGLHDFIADSSATSESRGAFSPDGTKFVYQRSDSNTMGLYVINADGSGTRNLLDATEGMEAHTVVWVGDRIYFSAFSGGPDYREYVYQVNDDDTSTSPTRVSPQYWDCSWPGVTSDESTLTCVGDASGLNQLFTCTIGSCSTSQLTTASSYDYRFSEPSVFQSDYPEDEPSISYVALGDSVPAGEGTYYDWHWNGGWDRQGPSSPTWEYSVIAGQSCHVSKQGYPHVLAFEMNWALSEFGCTGAKAVDGVLNAQDSVSAGYPQLGKDDGYDDPNPHYDSAQPDVVSLQVGMNDIGFAGFLLDCYSTTPPGATCATSNNDVLVAQRIATAQEDIEKVLQEIVDRGEALDPVHVPDVILLNYPDPFPLADVSCADFPSTIDDDEQTWLHDKLAQFTDMLDDFEQEFGNVTFVDISNAWGSGADHRYCGSDPWSYGPSIEWQLLEGGVLNGAPLHPTPAGQRRIAQLIKEAIS